MGLALVGWTAILARLLWADPHAANDCALLLARSVFADGNVYVPNLFLPRVERRRARAVGARRGLADPGVGGGVVGAQVGRPARPPPRRASSAGPRSCSCFAACLERWPSARTRPPGTTALALPDSAAVHFTGDVVVRDEAALSSPGSASSCWCARASRGTR